nr:MAG TPA: hypothetical protein [Caudoviricetes sp.]
MSLSLSLFKKGSIWTIFIKVLRKDYKLSEKKLYCIN